jgi:CheY-like chemotaxis protein
MPKVLIVSSLDLAPVLGRTVLWRESVERVFAPAGPEACAAALRLRPALVVVEGSDTLEALRVVRSLRDEPETRDVSISVLTRSAAEDEDALQRAGANLVLPREADPLLWDRRLQELLDLPLRREARIPVRLQVWSRFNPEAEPTEAMALDISLRGMLLETEDALDLGSHLDLSFRLPGGSDGDAEVQAVAQVVRAAALSSAGQARHGVEFLILRRDARERIRAFVTQKDER